MASSPTRQGAPSLPILQRRFSLLRAAILLSTLLLAGMVQSILANASLVAFDLRLADLLSRFRTPSLLTFSSAVTLLGEESVVLAASLLLTVLLWLKHRRLPVLVLWTTVIGSQAITQIGKFLFHRARPGGLLPAVIEGSFSFPSGHATNAVAFYGFLLYLVLRFAPSRKGKIGGLLTSVMIIFLIDFSRLSLGVHYLSDVLAGNLIGLIVLLLAVSTMPRLVSIFPPLRRFPFGM